MADLDINDAILTDFNMDGGIWNIIDDTNTYTVKNLTGTIRLRPGGYRPRQIDIAGEPQDDVKAGMRVPPSGSIEAYCDSELFTANELLAVLHKAPVSGLMIKHTYEFIQPDYPGATTGKKLTITGVIAGAEDASEITNGDPHGTINHTFNSTGTLTSADWSAS